MPKIIENIRVTILQTAKRSLLSEGYNRLSLREVAKECHIAVGTIYNYFPSKIALVTGIMLEDWAKHTAKMQEDCAVAENVEEGLRFLFYNMREFALLYQDVWSMSWNSKEVRAEMLNGRSRRQMLIEQLASGIRGLLERFKISYDSFLPYFIANSLLTYIMEPDFDYEQINKVFKTILYSNK
jgi:AcrR family transcriptional regulator